jgi:hypothetical protein
MVLSDLVTMFRMVAAGQALASLAQVSAGLALQGNGIALDARTVGGGATSLFSVARVAAGISVRRSARIPRWAVARSVGLFAADTLRMATGRIRLF